MSDLRVLVTGACGFIGSRLVPLLLQRGLRCCAIDDLSVGYVPLAPHDLLDFRVQDVTEQEGIRRTFAEFRPDVVVHLAAVHHIPTCEKNAPEALRVNVSGTQVVLDSAAANGCSRVVLASSGAVYDWCEGPLREKDTPVRPSDVYSVSKATNEHQLRLWVQKTEGTGIAARIFNTIGSGDPNAHLVPDALRQLRNGEARPTVRLGNLRSRRDYIYVDDTVAALATMVKVQEVSGFDCFNVGSGAEHDVRAVVTCLARIFEIEFEIEVDPTRVRQVDRLSQLADLAKTRSRLPWAPRYGLEEALRLTVTP